MKNSVFIPLSLCLILSSACSTAKIEKAWSDRKSSEDFQKEKAVFKERLDGKAPCWTTGVADFTLKTESPSNQCLYPSGAYVYEERQSRQYFKVLHVMQAMPSGFLVERLFIICDRYACHENRHPNLLFIHKTDEQGIVDGSYLDENPNRELYEYTGPFAYEAALGTRKTVHSFKKIPAKVVTDSLKGLKVYKLDDEMFAEIGAWWELEKSLPSEGK